MKKKVWPFTQIVTEDGVLCYSGEVINRMVKQSNANEVVQAFEKVFKDGDIVEVTIKRR